MVEQLVPPHSSWFHPPSTCYAGLQKQHPPRHSCYCSQPHLSYGSTTNKNQSPPFVVQHKGPMALFTSTLKSGQTWPFQPHSQRNCLPYHSTKDEFPLIVSLSPFNDPHHMILFQLHPKKSFALPSGFCLERKVVLQAQWELRLHMLLSWCAKCSCLYINLKRCTLAPGI